MPWLLLLHISTLLFWFGSLLYLPALITGYATSSNDLQQSVTEQGRSSSMPRVVFTLISTPAALLAIASGTAVFLVHSILGFWLMAKLTLVSALVLCHTLAGLLILRAEQGKHRHIKAFCLILGVASALIIAGILWLVLAKPL